MRLEELFYLIGGFMSDHPDAADMPVALEVGGDGAMHIDDARSIVIKGNIVVVTTEAS